MPGVNPPNSDRLLQIIGQMQQQVRALGMQQQLSFTDNLGRVYATLGLVPGSDPAQYGLLIVNPANGQPVAFFGMNYIPDGSGRSQISSLFWRDDGTGAFAISDTGTSPGHAHQQAVEWFDRSGNIVFSDDTTSGIGIATPYMTAGSFVDITAPTATTTSTSYTAMQWADCYTTHPKVTASVLAQTPAGVTANIRMTVAGVQVGSPLAVPANTFGQLTLPAASWPSYAWQSRVTVQLEMQVTSGTGTVGVRGLGLWQVQS